MSQRQPNWQCFVVRVNEIYHDTILSKRHILRKLRKE